MDKEVVKISILDSPGRPITKPESMLNYINDPYALEAWVYLKGADNTLDLVLLSEFKEKYLAVLQVGKVFAIKQITGGDD